ncbi:MAG: mannose-1-phosphate guanylyltransferase/mannose-6-phosphate isomerase [Nitrospirae bacterium]|nr:MAG: mannose-1-phosphate guanylyltransferase/mannose-6-phosphate isomerase [Nitrospirota bacterium]
MSPLSHLYAVVLAGGSGTRFWPMSRERFPKQLLSLIGEETLIQQTIRRILRLIPPAHVWVVTNLLQADSIKLQLHEWKDEMLDHILVEPEGRNTAPAIGWAALRLQEQDPDALMLVLPADHVIQGARKFRAAVSTASRLAQAGYLVTFGIKPTRPETGYGYIQPNLRARCRETAGRDDLPGYKVARFIEKPPLSRAKRYVQSGRYYWNSGMFLWKVSSILEELAQYQPRLFRSLQALARDGSAMTNTESFTRCYRNLPSLSIDYAVMERSSRAAVVPVDFGWSDVGSWASLPEVMAPDRQGNVITGNVVQVDSANSIVFAEKRLIGVIGLSEMVVVDTPDATLVCPKSRSQDVKRLVEMLKLRGAPQQLEHVTVCRPWGAYTVLEEGEGYKVKRITVSPGKRLSLQLHHHRSEHWVVIQGVARVTRGDEVFDLHAGESTWIPRQTAHRLENPGPTMLEIIEVQNGAYLGEDDIVRYQDDYGRHSAAR